MGAGGARRRVALDRDGYEPFTRSGVGPPTMWPPADLRRLCYAPTDVHSDHPKEPRA